MSGAQMLKTLTEAMKPLRRQKLAKVNLGGPADIKKIERSRARNRISAAITDHPFTDYWDIFVLKHRNPYNIALHAGGVVLFYGVLVAAWLERNPWLLFLLPLSQLVGLIGHYFFERSYIDLQDAVFSFRASRCLNRMFFKVVTGGYHQEIRRKNEALREYQLAKSMSFEEMPFRTLNTDSRRATPSPDTAK